MLTSLSQEQMELNKNTIVLYPSPGIGHLISMVELGKFILAHHSDFISQIIILITSSPVFHNDSITTYITRVSTATPSITFHHLPAITFQFEPTAAPETIIFEFLRLNNPNVHQTLQSISSTKSSQILAFVIDLFCIGALQVSSSLNIPTYYFFTSGASILSSFLYFPVIHETTEKSLKDLNAFVEIPGLPPIFSSDMLGLLDRNSKEYGYFMQAVTQIAKSAGIIINTFQSLEPRAIKAISDGLCLPNAPTPPLYCVGPLIATNNSTNDEHECLIWLNKQPSKSVVFLCFGSQGLFKEEQLREMAQGLESSGHRFLWVVRSPPPTDKPGQPLFAPQEPDLNALLPPGFLERTKGRGLVVKRWAPQIPVLNHDSVGGFVTHCGWNSILEAVCAGVPMIGWPLYAEQRMNRVLLVEELKLGLQLEELGEERFVSGTELEKRVRELMESEIGKMLRQRVTEMRDAAKAALGTADGSSRRALANLIAKWKE